MHTYIWHFQLRETFPYFSWDNSFPLPTEVIYFKSLKIHTLQNQISVYEVLKNEKKTWVQLPLLWVKILLEMLDDEQACNTELTINAKEISH